MNHEALAVAQRVLAEVADSARKGLAHPHAALDDGNMVTLAREVIRLSALASPAAQEQQILERAARECDALAKQFTTYAENTVQFSDLAVRHDNKAYGAERCADRIRALASSPEAQPTNAEQEGRPVIPHRSGGGESYFARPSQEWYRRKIAEAGDSEPAVLGAACAAPKPSEEEAARLAERLHAQVDQLAHRFRGYLPWHTEDSDSTVRSHQMFITDTIKRADELHTQLAALLAPAAPKQEPVAPANVKAFIDAVTLRISELGDRNSPEDWPEAMLVTGDELAWILEEALPELALQQGTKPDMVMEALAELLHQTENFWAYLQGEHGVTLLSDEQDDHNVSKFFIAIDRARAMLGTKERKA